MAGAIFQCRAESKKLSLTFVGDLMSHITQIDGAYDKKCKCYNFEPSFAQVTSVLSAADFTIGNLETTLPGKNYSGYPQFGVPDSYLDAVKNAGFDMLVTANNHSMDKGANALIRTIDKIREAGLLQTGTFRSIEEYEKNKVLFHEIKGFKLAFLNYTYGTNEIPVPPAVKVNMTKDTAQIESDIQFAKTGNPDFIIVLYHFGDEYKLQPNEFQKKMAKIAFDAGADIIIGSHPHYIQPYEFVQPDAEKVHPRKFIAWSLGNFISGQKQLLTRGGLILHLELEKIDDEPAFISRVSDNLVWVDVKYEGKKMRHLAQPVPNIDSLTAQEIKKLDSKMVEFARQMNKHLTKSRQAAEAKAKNTDS